MESDDIELTPITTANCAVLQVAGEIDAHTAPELREQITLLSGRGADHLVVDLRATSFIDSTGLGVLVGALKRIRERGGSLRLVTDGGRVLRLFEITKLTTAFALHLSVQEAIEGDEHWQAAIAPDLSSWLRTHNLR